MVHVVEVFRGALLAGSLSFSAVATLLAIGLLAVISGVLYFKRTQDTFADVV
jgi:ABC-type polysaccharide/polyol phosphate export permease